VKTFWPDLAGGERFVETVEGPRWGGKSVEMFAFVGRLVGCEGANRHQISGKN
jgi:hypothetical protein